MSDLNKMKEAYLSEEMNDIEVQKMKQKIRQAKAEKKSNAKRWMAACAAAVFMFVAVPNLSSTYAYAAGNLPVIGPVIKAVTFRDYHFDNGTQSADVKVQGIEGNDDVNKDIAELTDKWIEKFEKTIGNGYEDVKITSEVIRTTDEYFTLKVICSWLAGDGYEEDHYYTIDRRTGGRVGLDYIYDDEAMKEASEYIMNKMRADKDTGYFIDAEEIPENQKFAGLTRDSEFYINEKGHVVAVFAQGEVAPMASGVIEIEIDK